MKENDFDKYVRDLMSGAEEKVSPAVWKGVEAGLDRAARSRTVPMWLWRSLAGVAVAAAMAAGFILLRPDKNLSNQPPIQTPVASATTDEPLPAVTRPEEESVAPVRKQASRLQKRIAQAPEALPLEAVDVDEPCVEVTATPEHKPNGIIADVTPQPGAFTSDEDAFKQLAFEEHKIHRKGQFSMNILGNLQSNTRPESPTSRVRRMSPGIGSRSYTETTILKEGAEYSFGLPVSAGLSLRYDFNPRWGIGTGIVYTNLSRSFMGDYYDVNKDRENNTDITNIQHYIGIPVNVFFNIVNTGNWNFHVRLDGMGEKILDNHFLIHDTEGDLHLHPKTAGLQFSTGVGVGMEFKFSPNVGLYFDPTLRYYFDGKQPRSIRTIQPLRMDFELGLRLSLGQ